MGRQIFGYVRSLGLFRVPHSWQGRQIVEYLGRDIVRYLDIWERLIFGYLDTLWIIRVVLCPPQLAGQTDI